METLSNKDPSLGNGADARETYRSNPLKRLQTGPSETDERENTRLPRRPQFLRRVVISLFLEVGAQRELQVALTAAA